MLLELFLPSLLLMYVQIIIIAAPVVIKLILIILQVQKHGTAPRITDQPPPLHIVEEDELEREHLDGDILSDPKESSDYDDVRN